MSPMAFWLVASILVFIGLIGTVLPGLPGTALVFAGLVLAAGADGFHRVGGWPLAGMALLTALSFATDLASAGMGVKRSGASRWAVVGATLGGLFGLFFGIPGVLLGPFVGAVAGELIVVRDPVRVGKAGVGAWLGTLLGTAARVGLTIAMIGLFAAAYWW